MCTVAMAVFTYKALDAGSQLVSGTLVADTNRQAREQLHDRGMMVQEVVQKSASARPNTPLFNFRRSYRASTIEFTRDLSTLLGVGVPLLDALQTLGTQQTGGFRSIVLQLQDRIAAGASLAQAMRDHPDVFDRAKKRGQGEEKGTFKIVRFPSPVWCVIRAGCEGRQPVGRRVPQHLQA